MMTLADRPPVINAAARRDAYVVLSLGETAAQFRAHAASRPAGAASWAIADAMDELEARGVSARAARRVALDREPRRTARERRRSRRAMAEFRVAAELARDEAARWLAAGATADEVRADAGNPRSRPIRALMLQIAGAMDDLAAGGAR